MMMNSLLLVVAALLGYAGLALANDADQQRQRRARAALALAATEACPATYSAAYRLAVAREQPLVVFVDCQTSLKPELLGKAVVVATKELTGYERGTVVVSYPHGRTLYVHAILREPQPEAAIVEAVEAAGRKITTSESNRGPPCDRPNCSPLDRIAPQP
jgi:multisubunit Na+/H+ antiporter MnhE subunit